MNTFMDYLIETEVSDDRRAKMLADIKRDLARNRPAHALSPEERIEKKRKQEIGQAKAKEHYERERVAKDGPDWKAKDKATAAATRSLLKTKTNTNLDRTKIADQYVGRDGSGKRTTD